MAIPRSRCDAPQISDKRCNGGFQKLSDEARALSSQAPELLVSQQRHIDGASRSFADWAHQASQLTQARVSHDKDVDVAIRSTGARGPGAIDHSGMNVRTIKARAQLILDPDGAAQELGKRLVGSVTRRSGESVRSRLVGTVDYAGGFRPCQLAVN